MKKILSSKGVRNTVAVVVGLVLWLFIDTIISVLVGLLLNLIAQIPDDSALFQIILRFVITVINFRSITFVVNRIAIRNKKDYNIPEYVLSAIIVVAGIVLCTLNVQNQSLDVNGVIFYIFNTLLGVLLAFDAKEEFDI